MRVHSIFMLSVLTVLTGCRREVEAPRDLTPPAAPRGVHSVTGDNSVDLIWLANTERDVAGYRIYKAPCASGSDCPYTRIGSAVGVNATTFTATGLTNGVTAYYAVAAYDESGNESELSFETVFDTPRPAGAGEVVTNYLVSPNVAGWDFSAELVRRWDDPATDMYYADNGSIDEMLVPAQADIQDAGYAESLNAVDFAPSAGWSPTGSVELIAGHCYVVWNADDHYAKFRVIQFIEPTGGPRSVKFDWAYQVAVGNRELRARPVRDRSGARTAAWVR